MVRANLRVRIGSSALVSSPAMIFAPFRSTRTAFIIAAFTCISHGALSNTGDTILVRRAPILNGMVEGSVRVLTGEALTFNSGGVVTQDLHVPGTPQIRLNGSAVLGPTVTGAGPVEPQGWWITLNSGARLGQLLTRAEGGTLPVVPTPPAPSGTLRLSINSPTQQIGDFSLLRDLTLNSGVGVREIPPGTYGTFTANQGSALVLGAVGSTVRSVYHFQRLVLNSGSELRLLGPVEIVLAQGLALNAPMGHGDHPDWLECRIASGGLTLNTGVSFHGYVSAPQGTVVLNSNATLRGGSQSDRLTLNSGSRLIVVTQARPAPQPAIVSPSTGAALKRGEIHSVNVENSGGPAPAGIELWVNGEQIGQTATVPTVFPWQPTRHGVHRLQARALDSSGQTVTSAVNEVRVSDPLPLDTGFESGDGFVLGPIDGRQGWEGDGEIYAISADKWALRLSAVSERAQASLHFLPVAADTPLFAGVFVRPRAAPTPDEGVVAELAGARVSFVQSQTAGEGEFVVFEASLDPESPGKWRRLDQPAPTPLNSHGLASDWTELAVRYDHASERWDLHVDGMAVIADVRGVPLSDAERWSLRLASGVPAVTEFDDVYVDFENRTFTDVDRDGISDGWERYYGADTARNDRDADEDGDGLSNIIEFVLWTDPRKADSDGDGLDDGTERRLGLDPLVYTYPTDEDEDGRTQIEELIAGTDPNDFFNGQSPLIEIVSEPGDPDGRFVVKVSKPGGVGWPNAPVRFTVAPGEAALATNPDSTVTHIDLALRCDEQGLATVYVRPVSAEVNP